MRVREMQQQEEKKDRRSTAIKDDPPYSQSLLRYETESDRTGVGLIVLLASVLLQVSGVEEAETALVFDSKRSFSLLLSHPLPPPLF